MKTNFGDFQNPLPKNDLSYFVFNCLGQRLIEIGNSPLPTTSFLTLPATNPAVTIDSETWGEQKSEGTPKRNPKFPKVRPNDRVDKQDDYFLRINGGQKKQYCCLQAQYGGKRKQGGGAHGGVLIPYDEPYNYVDIAQALAKSATQQGQKGYRLFYTGVEPNRFANDLSEPERRVVKFDRFKSRANATQKLSVVCWSKECKGSKKPYSTKVTPAEAVSLDLLVSVLNKAQGFKKGLAVIKANVKLYCPTCNGKAHHSKDQ